MRPSLVVRWTRAVPLTAVPAASLRLPPSNGRPEPKSVDEAASPTVDRLLNSLERSAARLQRQGVSPAPRPAGNTAGEAASLNRLPPNLRINEFVPRRKVYEGVKASHRDLVSSCPRSVSTPRSRVLTIRFSHSCDDCDERHEVGGTSGSEIGREGAAASACRGFDAQHTFSGRRSAILLRPALRGGPAGLEGASSLGFLCITIRRTFHVRASSSR